MIKDFPATFSKERENLILDIVKNQQSRLSFKWITLISEYKNHKAEFLVMNDALKVDGIRINLTAYTEQLIADEFGALLLTAKLSDLIWHRADIRINPCIRPLSTTTQSMIDHSKDIDKQIIGQDISNKLISTAGKDWILSIGLAKPRIQNQACNHGWHFEGSSYRGIKGNINPSLLKNPKTGQYWKLIQPSSYHHNYSHCDSSQTCRLVARDCKVDGQVRDLIDILKDRELSYLASHEGPLPLVRQPGVPDNKVEFVV